MSASLQGLSVVACTAPHSERATMPSADAHDMQAIRSGDKRAFQRLVRRHQHAVLTYCYRLTTDETAAQDIAQEVFLTLWKEREKYTEQGKLKYYLIRIARLRALALLKKYRASKRLQERASEALQVRPTAPSYSDDIGLQAALARLSRDQRDILILRHLEGLDLAEIRSVTGLRIGTIKSRIHRAMIALRKELDDET